MKLIFLGAPGAGKGTQADIVSEKLGIPTISTGNIIRAALKDGTEMGKKAKEYIDAGSLVPDDVVIGIIKERLAESDCKNGFILDGFPRTIPQAEALDEMGIEIDKIVDINVSDERIIKRMGGRRSCSCGATYHTIYNPPINENICDKCDSELTIRADDKPTVVKERLDTYHEQTEPLKDYYEKKGKLISIEGQEELANTTILTLTALGLT